MQASFKTVRIGWQTQGQPWTPSPSVDTIFVRAIEDDDEYNRIRDRENVYLSDVLVTQVDIYTRVWRIFWTVYGPNAFDNGRKLRSGLFNPGIYNTLAGSNLYWITDVPAPVRVPELYDKQWFDRVDFYARFNEQVTEANTIGTVQSVEVIVNDAASSKTPPPLIDVTIES